jgi:hypothetical protein
VEDLQDHSDEPVDPASVEAPGAAGAEHGEAARRRRPSTVGGAIYIAVLAAAGVGLGVVTHGNWRLGVKWIAAALVVAAAARLVLPPQEAGMLGVRRRLVDVGILTVIGVVLWFLSTNIPNQPGP